MQTMEFDITNNTSKRSKGYIQYIFFTSSILLGLLCIAGFILASIEWDVSSKLVKECKSDSESIVLCYIRLVVNDSLPTEWNRYITISILLTYASVFYYIITETSRTNVSGLLGQMILQTICIIFGIGPAFSILFIPAYIYFYKSNNRSNKSPVPIEILSCALIYTIIAIIIPTYFIYFLSSKKVIVSIASIILLLSPIGFTLVSLPIRLCSESIQRCWFISSHRLVIYSQIVIFIFSVPLFFIVIVSLGVHWSSKLIKISYVNEISNVVNPISVIWSLDYVTLLIGLILFIIIHEYLFSDNLNHQTCSSIIRRVIYFFIYFCILIISPCLAFPLYVAWKEVRFMRSV